MQLGLYRTTFAAAARLSSSSEVSSLGKIIIMMTTNRGVKSRANAHSVNSRDNKLAEAKDGGSPPRFLDTSHVAYEEEFPPLSASRSSVLKSKRRTKIDLGSFSVPNKDNIGPLQHEAPTSVSHQNDDLRLPTSFGKKHVASVSIRPEFRKTSDKHKLQSEASSSLDHQSDDLCLPTSFGKKHVDSASRSPKLHKTHHKQKEAKGSAVFSSHFDADEPFDICLSGAREASSVDSSVNEKNEGRWVQEVEPAEENGQSEHDMEEKNTLENSVEEIGKVLRPGMVLLKQYIPLCEQVNIVNRCRELGLGPGGFYRPGYNDGAKLRLYMMCLGLDWDPQTRGYGKRRLHDNAAPPDIPQEFTSLISRVLDDSHTAIKRDSYTENIEDILPRMSPDVCIVNFYTVNGRLGLHQDRDESPESLRKGFPVVSLSIGNSAEFLYGDERDVKKAESVLLESGDVLIFGGKSRHIFHGVTSIVPDTAPPALVKNVKLRPGRLNLTFRKY